GGEQVGATAEQAPPAGGRRPRRARPGRTGHAGRPARIGGSSMTQAQSARGEHAGDPLVRMRGIIKKFGSTMVLDGIDLDVSEGEVVCLIGPSGAGKSTLLRCINGLERISGGTIHLGGEELVYEEKTLNRLRSRIGMVFQSFNLFPHMTVLENVSVAQREVLGRGKQEARQKAEGLLDR